MYSTVQVYLEGPLVPGDLLYRALPVQLLVGCVSIAQQTPVAGH